MEYALRLQAFGRVEASYWLRAALAILPADIMDLDTETPHQRARRLERLLLQLMNLAFETCHRVLGREHCRDDADCDRVIDYLLGEGADEVDIALGRRSSQPAP